MVEEKQLNINQKVRKSDFTLGIIIPCYDEEDVLPLLFDKLDALAKSVDYKVKFLLIDDGSLDQSFSLIHQKCAVDSRYACIKFSRNFGHQTAVSAGLKNIVGDVVGIIDADLQDPPYVIDEMVQKWLQGYDVVYGIRKNRKESFFLRCAYSIFYRLLKRIANIEVPLDAGDFSVMDRSVVQKINAMPEHNRFIRGLRGWVGFKQIGHKYERMPRAAGKPKYNLRKLFRLAFDGIVTLSSFPLKIASWLGGFSALLGLLFGLYALIDALFFDKPPSGWPSLAMLIIFFGGIQLMVLGIIGEYIGRIFDETKRRPLYITESKKGWLLKNMPQKS